MQLRTKKVKIQITRANEQRAQNPNNSKIKNGHYPFISMSKYVKKNRRSMLNGKLTQSPNSNVNTSK